jgi:predicted methyltransferase
MRMTIFAILIASSLAACTSTKPRTTESAPADAPAASAVGSPALEEVLAGSHRSESNRSRDRYRHPAETLRFFGVQQNQHILEITPGGGWYSEILAPWLNGRGQFTAAIWDDTLPNQPGYYASLNKQLREKFAAAPQLYGKARLLGFDAKAPDFSAAAPLDVILTFRNVHNWTMAGNDAAWFKAFYTALKPGGVLGVVDHRAAAGTEIAEAMKSGYLTEAYVTKLATSAGFVLEASSEINANPADTRSHPKGVWTLPPMLALGETDRAKYLAIGESDRMTLRFRKPAGDAIHSADD